MQGLFERVKDLDAPVMRNIVSLRQSEDLFDDLHEGDHDLAQIAVWTEMAVKPDESPTVIERGFHYSTAILYPFRPENWLRTRYSDGRYPAWYGSMSAETTLWETGYHALKAELAVEGVSPQVYRERAVYRVHCRGLLIDISGKAAEYPYLISNDYGECQSVGQRVHQEGHPGLLSPSARHPNGVNVVAFRKTILQYPRLSFYLSYLIDTRTRTIQVERAPGKALTLLDFAHMTFWD